MPSLLDLPTELRGEIIENVLRSRRTPPAAPSKSQRREFQDIQYKALRGRCGIYNEQRATHCPSTCLPLLLTNRQLSVETKWILGRRASRIPYVLDISVLNDLDLFPTWLSVPRTTNRIGTLWVDIRLFGHILSRDVARLLGGAGGRFGFHWSFYALLERFFRYGPVDEKKIPDSSGDSSFFGNPTFDDRDISVDVLTLAFQSAESEFPDPPDHITYRMWRVRQYGADRFQRHPDARDKYSQLEHYRTRPEWLAEYLSSEIRGLLHMGYHTAEYGKFLYERIGIIRMIVDGTVTEIDLGATLAEQRFTDPADTFGHVWPREERVPTFWRWKKNTLARREELGFPVVWPQDPELNA
ncbi:uncharacterized protein N7459_003773 [Penicillium hispanicum]|uniref:uncharacterized protein n=1 Tax=Penicillium hispanicum TaxID=1080232 RepID=UPI0025404B31|nr:uncharacterized protein N7459_003773 [Penicillium hispanicum]KAJ5588008.1 hypothetical protein N7459_003773 [Penicillium hispanicum]